MWFFPNEKILTLQTSRDVSRSGLFALSGPEADERQVQTVQRRRFLGTRCYGPVHEYTMYVVGAVSYTHLDVYKRQV